MEPMPWAGFQRDACICSRRTDAQFLNFKISGIVQHEMLCAPHSAKACQARYRASIRRTSNSKCRIADNHHKWCVWVPIAHSSTTLRAAKHEAMTSQELSIPILPHNSPAADQPPGLRLPLYPHQLRALHRCLVVEHDGSLGTDFGNRFDYKSRGGCLADSVGTGKTAVAIGLCLSSAEAPSNDTLVVAPTHLIPQWKREIEKMVQCPEQMEVVVGKEEYLKTQASAKPRIVLIDVDTIVNEKRLWYDWRRVFTGPGGPQLKATEEEIALYRKAAIFSVQSPRGPCSYTGWVYTGPLHLPSRPWRRVIFDEIQDLVGSTESGKNLLQLTRTAQHVWLLSATPFPHGHQSVYANHELLGFCRLYVKDTLCGGTDSTLERIKKRLYIRSPRHVADTAVSVTVQRQTITVTPLDLETRFSLLEVQRIQQENSNLLEQKTGVELLFTEQYNPVREMAVHPEASQELRKQMTRSSSAKHVIVRPVSQSVDMAAQRAIQTAQQRLRELQSSPARWARQVRDTDKTLALAIKLQQFRATFRPVGNTNMPFGIGDGSNVTEQRETKERQLIHDHYCGCGSMDVPSCNVDRLVCFRNMRNVNDWDTPEFIRGNHALERTIQYVQTELAPEKFTGNGIAALNQFITVTKRTLASKKKELEQVEKEKATLELRIKTLSESSSSKDTKKEDNAEANALAQQHGSKPAALVRFLRSVVADKEQVIVFSYWHDTLKLIGQTLTSCGLSFVFCHADMMADALAQFSAGTVPILLLSAQSKASGANLQCATHVVLLDPAGQSAKHGSTLEEQAIGRAVRMGQERPVTVTRFCVAGSIEELLFTAIDAAQQAKVTKNSGSSYVIQDAHKGLGKGVVVRTEATKSCCNTNAEDEIAVTAAVSANERLSREFEKAEQQGEVIDIDAEEENTGTIAVSADVQSTGILVKTEAPNEDSSSASRKRHGDIPTETPAAKQLRTTTTTTPASRPIPCGTQEEEEDAAEAAATVTPDKMEKIGKLLRRLDLEQYEAKFASAGYDNLDFLLEQADNVAVMEQLSADVGFLPGHALRFQMSLTKEASNVH